MSNRQILCRICGSHEFSQLNLTSAYQALADSQSLNELIRPCNCRAEFAYVHRICLSNWLETTKHEHCDICLFKYHTKKLKLLFVDWFFDVKRFNYTARILSIVTLIYYVSMIGLLVTQSSNATRFIQLDLIRILILFSSYAFITLATIFVVHFFYQTVNEFLLWRETNFKIIVDENPNAQLRVDIKSRGTLRLSNFKPKSLKYNV